MKRFSVICLQCGLSVNRLIEVETTQTEIHPVTYRQKCKIAPDAADFDCPELERAVEMSRRWDPIFQGGMSRPAIDEKADLSVEAADLSRPASSDDAVVFPEALSEAAVNAEKADLSVEAADLPRPASSDDAVVFPEALSEAAVNAEKADLSVEAADLSASVGVTDTVNGAPTTPGDLALDELRSALSKALERFSAGGDARL
jgi:hypothetical protein